MVTMPLVTPQISNKTLRIVRISGGLGNQMFQYAFGVAANADLFDVTGFQTNHYRNFDLDLYNIERNFATEKQVRGCLNEVRLKNILPRFIRKCLKMDKYVCLRTNRAKEKQINRYQPELLQLSGNVYYDGFFQSDKYFKPFREKLLHDFRLKEALDEANKQMLERISQNNAVAVHIRRGDYLHKKSPFTYLDTDYYQKAMAYIAERVENPHFFIFSNDAEWVRQNIHTSLAQTIVEINDEKHGYFDLELMRNCRHAIIANSTFSWWGAWLCTNPDKIVVAPKQWFRPDADEYSGDIVPDEWVKI